MNREREEKSPLKQKNVSPSALDESPVRAPNRKRARILESDEEEEENTHSSPASDNKSVAQRLEAVCTEKNTIKVLNTG